MGRGMVGSQLPNACSRASGCGESKIVAKESHVRSTLDSLHNPYLFP